MHWRDLPMTDKQVAFLQLVNRHDPGLTRGTACDLIGEIVEQRKQANRLVRYARYNRISCPRHWSYGLDHDDGFADYFGLPGGDW